MGSRSHFVDVISRFEDFLVLLYFGSWYLFFFLVICWSLLVTSSSTRILFSSCFAMLNDIFVTARNHIEKK